MNAPESLSAQTASPTLAILQAHDRANHTLVQHRVTRWPVSVGRSLQCDWVLDDPHLAPEHLRIEAVDASDALQVQVMQTDNGIWLGQRQHTRGQQFAWPPGQELHLGRLSLGARLASQAQAPEQALTPPWRRQLSAWIGTVLPVLGVCLFYLATEWLRASEGGGATQALTTLAAVVAVISVWALFWALVSKLFVRRLLFWQHLRIACGGGLAIEAVSLLANLAAFTFSWEALARFDNQVLALGLAATLWWHLKLALPVNPKRLGLAVAALTAVGIGLNLVHSWQTTKRLSDTLYMTSFFPPDWRLAPAVPPAQWLQESQSLKARLDQRLADKHDDLEEQRSNGLD